MADDGLDAVCLNGASTGHPGYGAEHLAAGRADLFSFGGVGDGLVPTLPASPRALDAGILRRLNVRWRLPLFAVITIPWFVLAARENADFLHYFFIREHVQRFLTPIEHRTEPWWFFGPVLGVGVQPWLPQVLRAATLPFDLRTHRPFDP